MRQFPWEALRVGVRLHGRSEANLVQLLPVVTPPARWPAQAILAGGQGHLALQLRVHFRSPSRFQLCLQVSNVGRRPVRLDEAVVLSLAAEHGGLAKLIRSFSRWFSYESGWQSWSDSRVRKISQLGKDELRLASSDMTVLGDPEGVMLLGFTELDQYYSEIVLQLNPQRRWRGLQAVVQREGLPLESGETWQAPELLVAFDTSVDALLDLYARQLAPADPALLAAPSPTGWCTWYYYYGSNGETDIHRNLVALNQPAAVAIGSHLEWMLIDDGHQSAVGDWLITNSERYPSGMKDLADRIRAAGKKPGIWLAPFSVTRNSLCYREHPDWVIRQGSDGPPVKIIENWGSEVYGLDVTQPGVQNYVRQVAGTLTRDWGYELLKIDFIHHAALAGHRHDLTLTRIQAYRRGLELIREEVGPGIHLLGCGAPLGASIGLVDSMRIGEDVHRTWQYTKKACLNIVMRNWQHRHWWVNDPDCVMVRPSGDVMEMNLEEELFLATVVAMSGGSLLVSDNFTSLPQERWDLLGKLLPVYGQPMQVLGWLSEFPEWLELDLRSHWGHWRLIGLLNWEDYPRPLSLDFDVLAMSLRPIERAAACHVFDFWRNQYSRVMPGYQLRLVMPAHSAHLLLVRPVLEVPSFVATTRHWTQGKMDVADIAWDTEGHALVLDLLPTGSRQGQLLIHVPPPYVLRDISGHGIRVLEWAAAPHDMASVTVEVSHPGTLVLRCPPA